MKLGCVLLVTMMAAVIKMSTSSKLKCEKLMANAPSECNCNETRKEAILISCVSLSVELIDIDAIYTVTINCQLNPINLTAIPNLYLGGIYGISILDCPLTNISARAFIDALGINKIYRLGIHSKRKLKYSFDNNMFQNLSRVTHIDIQGLNITNLSSDAFDVLVIVNNTSQLYNLSLKNNSLKEIQPGTFKSLTNLEDLDLSSNDITTISRAVLSGLNNVSSLSLGNNKLYSLDRDVFHDLNDLMVLKLYNNSIQSLHKDLFLNNIDLDELDLSNNKISNIPDGFFGSTTKLKNLSIEGNEIVRISGLILAPLQNLEELHLSNNKIEHFCEDQDSPNYKLRWLNLSNNKLKSLKGSNTNKSTLILLSDINRIDLSNNSLSQMYEDWYGMNSSIDLSHNQLQSVQIEKLAYSRIVSIDLSHNNITQLLMPHTIYEGDIDENSNKTCIYLLNNPLNCDCKMFDFVHFLQSTDAIYRMDDWPSSIHFSDGPNLTCTYPHSLQSIPLFNLSQRSLTCEINDDDNYQCPSQCTCTYRPADHANIINCSSKGLDKIPLPLPLYWEANHTELEMTENKLGSDLVTPDREYQNITFMNLSNNHLSTFSIPREMHLKVLDLSYNDLTNLDEDTVSALETLDRMALHHNPWQCDCDSLYFLHMIKRNKKRLLREVTCADNRAMTELRDNELCPGFGFIIEKHIWWFIAGVVLLLLITMFTVLYLVYYKNKIRILTYCYSSQWRLLRWVVLHPDDIDVDKRYDAFISFAHEDIQFVADTLVPHLEENDLRKYKICLHYRDWVIGGDILNQICTSIKSSRRTLIIMSPAFLQSVWGVAEFRTAYIEEIREGRQRLIVIMYKDVSNTEGLNEEVQDYLQTTTYLVWEDTPAFWKRLFYALPHPPRDTERININCSCFGGDSHEPTGQEDSAELKLCKNT